MTGNQARELPVIVIGEIASGTRAIQNVTVGAEPVVLHRMRADKWAAEAPAAQAGAFASYRS